MPRRALRVEPVKRLLPVLLMLAGCDSRPPAEETAEVDPSELMPDLSAQDPRRVQQRIDRAFAGTLAETLFTDVRATPLGSICGYVDDKDKQGRYKGRRPFLITPDGLPLVSTSPRIMFEIADDIFPDFYIRWCATPEEMRRIGPLIAARDSAAAAAPEPFAPDLMLPGPLPAETAEPAPVPPPPPKKEEEKAKPSGETPDRQAADADSFFNAVIRKKDEQKQQE